MIANVPEYDTYESERARDIVTRISIVVFMSQGDTI